MSDTSTWLPILTLVVGAAAGGGVEWLRDKRAWRRGREEREQSRREERHLHRLAFQRETLVGLQDGLQRLGRVEARIHHEDETAFNETGAWGRNRLSKDASDAGGEAARDIHRLASRVDDVEVRDACWEFTRLYADASMSLDRDEALSTTKAAGEVLRRVIARTGEVLRTLD